MDRTTLREHLRETAAAWHDRVHRDKVPDEARAAFACWLAESPEHRGAYEEIERSWADLKSTAHDPRILALRHEAALRLTRRTSKTSRPRAWATAAIIVIALGASLAGLRMQSMGERSPIAMLVDAFHTYAAGRYATATGERLTVTLEDGSQLTLNTRTDLKVAFTRAERVVRLARGQALFEVAKDARRPFIVEANNRRFVAVGTAFDVRIDGAQIDVTMIEGTVRVERATNLKPTDNAGSTAMQATRGTPKDSAARTDFDTSVSPQLLVTTLTAGEQLTVDNESHDHVRSADPERVTSWRHGQIIFDNTRLADAIAELNRYSDIKIELTDPTLADLRLSGGFATGHPNLFIEAITSYFPIQVAKADDHVVMLRARK
jgi:transmembrane sensor